MRGAFLLSPVTLTQMWMDKLSIIESMLDLLKVVGQGLIFVGLHREFELIFSLLDYQSLQVG